MRPISFASGGCSLSCPVFSKFAKLTGVPYEKNLRLSRDARHEAVARLQLRSEYIRRHGYGVDLPPQPLACGVERLDDTNEGRRADDHDVHVARRTLLALRHGAENECKPHFAAERLERFPQHVCKPGGLAENARQLLEDRAGPVRLIADLVARRGAR